MEWDSEVYKRFEKERTQPALDLAAKIPLTEPKQILDIGCGPGNSTRVLADRFPAARVIGADSSPEMIRKAKEDHPDLDFILFDASRDFDTLNEEFDVVFSNACIQWIPHHVKLLKNMMSVLRKNGVLAVQTPMNYREPIHRIIQELVKTEKWSGKFNLPSIFHNLTQGEYFDILSELSRDFTVWETVYCHRMPSHQSIVDWYKGTGLRPYLSALTPDDANEFESDVLREVKKAYPIQKNGEIIFRFPRFFFMAIK